MTIWEQLNRKRYRALCFAGLPAWLAGVIGATTHNTWIIFPAFAAFFGTVVYLLFGLRCPVCRGNLGYLLAYSAPTWIGGRRARYCPFCATPLDTDLKNLPCPPLS